MNLKFAPLCIRLTVWMSILASSGCDRDPTVLYTDLHLEDGWVVRGVWSKESGNVIYSNFHWLRGEGKSAEDIANSFRFCVSEEGFDISRLNPELIRMIGLHEEDVSGEDVLFSGGFINGFTGIEYDESGIITRIGFQFRPEAEFSADHEHAIPERFAVRFRGGPKIDSGLIESELRKSVGIGYSKERQRGLEF